MRRFRIDYGKAIARVIGESGFVTDAGETAMFSRSLEYIYKQTYDVLYPEFQARSLVPVDYSVPTGAESWTYSQYDEIGQAAIIANYANDLPGVDVDGKQFSGTVKGLGDQFSYSIQDLRAAAMSGTPLDMMRARAARRRIEAKLDDLIALGDANYNFEGFLKLSAAPIVALANAGTWATKVGAGNIDQVIADFNKLVNNVFSSTKGIHTADTVVMPQGQFALIATTKLSQYTETTILQHLLKTNPWVRNIGHWHKATSAGAGATDRMVAYQRSPEVVQALIPQEFEQLPPQVRSLAFTVPCHMRYGGLKVPYPKAINYMDGI